ncbi:hypothetical protein SOASR015_21230 [Pectobacterium carotovorum subsp. carotovorum]|nr:hypothetical protein SOASR015_21230 [Pectobacterium carotovorum subsp. carotovorum]GLX57390.1 hypothetical protein Pcaca02_26990 [Pectobacterium carotovorum subsp. carotovorum]
MRRKLRSQQPKKKPLSKHLDSRNMTAGTGLRFFCFTITSLQLNPFPVNRDGTYLSSTTRDPSSAQRA